MNMTSIPLAIPDVVLIKPKVFGDDRGFFFESFNKASFQKATGISADFVQDNHSQSCRGVLRGMHFQRPPHAQGKLVRVVSGEVFDVAVDIRPESPSFGMWVGEYLSSENKHQLWIPEGFAHGFLVLSELAEFVYKTTDYYAPESEGAFVWNDPVVGIQWPVVGNPVLSGKDANSPLFRDVAF